MTCWIVSSKHSRDSEAADWDSKWTADGYLRHMRFVPVKRRSEFNVEDRCIVKTFGSQEFIADFRIATPANEDGDGDIYYEINEITEWDFPIDQHSLPQKYTRQLSRSPSTDISESDYWELLGIRNFTQNLRLNYKNRICLNVSEREIETFIDAKNALRQTGLEIIERQYELSPGNIIDLLCRDRKGDLVVVELKKHSANQTVGQLARYITDVREKKAKSTQKVKGMILALDIDEQLVMSARSVDFEVVLCQLTFG